jgi:hypothetical protein
MDSIGVVNKMAVDIYDLVLMVCISLERGHRSWLRRMSRCPNWMASLQHRGDPQTPIILKARNLCPSEILAASSSGLSPALHLHHCLPGSGIKEILPKPVSKEGLLHIFQVLRTVPLPDWCRKKVR